MQPQLLVEATGERRGACIRRLPYTEWTANHYVSIHNNPPGVETERPAIVANHYGAGRTVYFGPQVGAMYATASYWEVAS